MSRGGPIIFEKIAGALFPQTFREKCGTSVYSSGLTGVKLCVRVTVKRVRLDRGANAHRPYFDR